MMVKTIRLLTKRLKAKIGGRLEIPHSAEQRTG